MMAHHRRHWREPAAWLALLGIALAALHWRLSPTHLVMWLSGLGGCG